MAALPFTPELLGEPVLDQDVSPSSSEGLVLGSNELFRFSPESTYWVGRVTTQGEVHNPLYWDRLAKFRSIYVDLGFKSPESLDEEGRLTDDYDSISDNFAVVENTPDGEGFKDTIVGSGRLIVKDAATLLPIEDEFPELFGDSPIPPGYAEASRFIAKHEKKFMQRMISASVLRALTFRSIGAEIDEVYCMVEVGLKRMLAEKVGLPVEQLTEDPKDIPSQGGALYPIAIKPAEVLESLRNGESAEKQGVSSYKQFFGSAVDSSGEGFFDNTLMRGQV